MTFLEEKIEKNYYINAGNAAVNISASHSLFK